MSKSDSIRRGGCDPVPAGEPADPPRRIDLDRIIFTWPTERHDFSWLKLFWLLFR